MLLCYLRPSAVLVSDLQEVAADTALLLNDSNHDCRMVEPMEAWTQGELLRAAEYVRLWEDSEPGKRCGWDDLVCHVGDDPRTVECPEQQDSHVEKVQRVDGVASRTSPFDLAGALRQHGFPDY